jgi:hypothetical protein
MAICSSLRQIMWQVLRKLSLAMNSVKRLGSHKGLATSKVASADERLRTVHGMILSPHSMVPALNILRLVMFSWSLAFMFEPFELSSQARQTISLALAPALQIVLGVTLQ